MPEKWIFTYTFTIEKLKIFSQKKKKNCVIRFSIPVLILYISRYKSEYNISKSYLCVILTNLYYTYKMKANIKKKIKLP